MHLKTQPLLPSGPDQSSQRRTWKPHPGTQKPPSFWLAWSPALVSGLSQHLGSSHQKGKNEDGDEDHVPEDWLAHCFTCVSSFNSQLPRKQPASLLLPLYSWGNLVLKSLRNVPAVTRFLSFSTFCHFCQVYMVGRFPCVLQDAKWHPWPLPTIDQ